jgi:outer membrane protein assembly factor BamB/tetratricopeptide (TPR) repeat protein
VRTDRCGALATFFLCCLLVCTAGAQERNFDGWDMIVDPSFSRNPDRLVLRNFRLPEGVEAERLIVSARESIAEGRYSSAVASLHEVITALQGKVFQAGRESCSRSRSCARFVGAAELSHYLLSTLPPEGREIYDAFAAKQALEDFENARARRDLDAVEEIADTYCASSLGESARIFLADTFCERGDVDLAVQVLKKSLLFSRAPERGVLLRLARTLDQAGHESEAAACLTPCEPGDEGFRALLTASPPLVEPPGSDWTSVGGGPNRNRAMPFLPGAGFAAPRWSRDPFNDTLTDRNPFAEDREGPVPFRLVRDGDTLIVNDSVSVRAFSIYSGEILWHFAGPLEERAGSRAIFGIDDYIRHRGQAGSITNHLIAGATSAGPVLLVNLQAGRPRRKKQFLYNEVINKPIPIRHLHALSAFDGKLLWKQAGVDIDPDSFFNRLSIASPPVVVDDRVFCNGHLVEGGVRSFILCFDLESGDLIWKTPVGVGQQALTLFNMSFSEFVATPLTLEDGTLYFCSNLGYVAALDAMTGRIRWCTEYETTELPRSHSYTNPPPRQVHWYNTPPRASGGVVISTPLDARSAFAFDRHTGKVLWSCAAQSICRTGLRYLMGIRGGTAIFGGSNGASALDVETGNLAWRTMALLSLRNGEPCRGQGALAGDRAYLSLGDKVVVVDVGTGKLVEEKPMGEAIRRGQSLFLFGDVTVRVTAGSVRVSFDAEGMLGRALARLAKKAVGHGSTGESRFDDLAFVGDMYRLRGDREEAASYFRKALAEAAGAKPRSLNRVRSGLYNSLLGEAVDALKEGAPVRAEELLLSAARTAPGAEEEVRCLAELAGIHVARKEWGKVEKVRERLAGVFRQVNFDFGGRLGIGLGRAGFFASLLACHVAAEKKDAGARLAALRVVLELYPEDLFGSGAGNGGRDESVDGGGLPVGNAPSGVPSCRASKWASAAIAALIAEEGREIYAACEGRAREIYTDALALGSVDLLLTVGDLYPNSLIAPRAVLDGARLLIDRGRPGDAYGSLSRLAGRKGGSDELPHAFFLLARAAEGEGNVALAEAYYERIRSRYSRVESLWDEGVRYGQLIPAGERVAPAVRRSPPLPAAPFAESAIVLKTDSADLLEIHGLSAGEGAPPSWFADRALLRLTDPERLCLVDTAAMKIVWEKNVDLPEAGDPQYAFAAGRVLTVCYDHCLFGLDAETGARLWGRHLEGWLLDVLSGRGILEFASIPREGYDEDIIAIEAINPVTGSILWKRLIHDCRELRFVPSKDVFACVINDRVLTILDPLTGATEKSETLDCVSAQPYPFPSPPGRLVLKAGKPGRKNFLLAVDAFTGKEAWRFSSDRSIVSFSKIVLCPAGLLLTCGNSDAGGYLKTLLLIDTATGEVRNSVELAPPDVMFTGASVIDDTRVYLHPMRTTRNFSVSALETATGQWRFEDAVVDLSGCGGRHRMVQDGVYAADGLVVGVSCIPAQRGSTVTGSVFFLDGSTGKVTFFKQLHADAGNTRGIRSRKEIGIQLKGDAVLLLARNRLICVRSQQ